MKWFQGVLTGGGTVIAYNAWGLGGAIVMFLLFLAFDVFIVGIE